MIWFARTMIDCGTSTPIALAAFILITSSTSAVVRFDADTVANRETNALIDHRVLIRQLQPRQSL